MIERIYRKPTLKIVVLTFIYALALNIIWENAHTVLYSGYMGGKITEFILLRASLFDAILITFILLASRYITLAKNRGWLIFIIGVVIAIVNEWYGLGTGRWMYNELMPIIPIIKTGLSPTLQLGIISYVIYKILNHNGNLARSPSPLE